MIIKEIFYAVKCDRCGAINNEDDTSFWSDESTAENQAFDDEWLVNEGKHYCPNCFTVDDETDETIVKPAFPDSVKQIRKFINTITKNIANVSEKDDRFEIYFYERYPLGQAARNWIVECYPIITVNEEILRNKKKIIITIKK